MKRHRPPPGRWQLPVVIDCATIIGLGGIGRQVALQLAGLGIPRLQLIDSRIVARATQAAEGYLYDDAGRPRIHATADLCHQVKPRMDILTLTVRSLQGIDPGDAVICCPGSPSTWRALRRQARDETVISSADVTDDTIQLEFVRGATMLDGRTGTSPPCETPRSSARRADVPTHVSITAAGLLVAELVRFTSDDRSWCSVRFDLHTLQVDLKNRP